MRTNIIPLQGYKKLMYSKPGDLFNAAKKGAESGAKAGTKKVPKFIPFYGTKGGKPSNGVGWGGEPVIKKTTKTVIKKKESKKHEGKETKKHEAKESKAFEKKENKKKNWIAGTIKKPGALHKQLGIKQGKKIPKKTLAKAIKKGGKLGKRAALAKTLASFHKKKGMC